MILPSLEIQPCSTTRNGSSSSAASLKSRRAFRNRISLPPRGNWSACGYGPQESEHFQRKSRQPDIELLKALLEDLLEADEKLAVLLRVGYVDKDPNRFVPVDGLSAAFFFVAA